MHSLPPVQKRSAREKARAALEALLAMSSDEYVELAFSAASLSNGYQFDDEAFAAATAFDERHQGFSSEARGHLLQLEITPTDLGVRHRFKTSVVDVRRNRYFTRETVDGVRRIKPSRRRKRNPWSLETSCWKDRKRLGNSKDFFETPDAIRKLFMADWGMAVRSHELAWYIVKCQNEPQTWRDLDRHGSFGEVEEVREALWRHYHALYGAFDYYAVLYSENENAPGEPDVFNMSFNAFMQFVEHNGMTSKRLGPGEFETIWAIVNAVDKNTGAEDKHNKGKFLNRQEFLQCLVRCAVAVYVKRGTIGDVSDSVNQLFCTNLLPTLHPYAMQNSNAFRKRFCYIQPTSNVLEAHLASLRTLYELYAEVSDDQRDALKDDALMSIGEWMAFCKHVGLFEARQLSFLQAKYIFIWSRIRSVEDLSDAQEIRLRHMFFEDFLEGLVRMALMIALPTDMEIEEVNAADAGDFLISMQADDPNTFAQFVTERKPSHKDPDGTDYDEKEYGYAWKRVEHLIQFLVRTIEFNTSAINDDGKADGVVQANEAAKFIRQRTLGRDISRRAGSLAGTDFVLAMENAKSKAITTAAAIKIQMANRAKRARAKVAERRRLKEEQERAGGEDATAEDEFATTS